MSPLQDPVCIRTRTWEYRSGNKEMYTGVSVALGKLWYCVPNRAILKEVYHIVFCQSNMLCCLWSQILILCPYPTLTFFWCPNLPHTLCSTGCECSSLTCFLIMCLTYCSLHTWQEVSAPCSLSSVFWLVPPSVFDSWWMSLPCSPLFWVLTCPCSVHDS